MNFVDDLAQNEQYVKASVLDSMMRKCQIVRPGETDQCSMIAAYIVVKHCGCHSYICWPCSRAQEDYVVTCSLHRVMFDRGDAYSGLYPL